MSKKIKDEKGARRELMRVLRMLLKARWLLKQGDRKNGVEVYHVSADHSEAALEFILAYYPHNQELNRLMLRVVVAGIRLEERFNLRKEG